MTGLTFIAYGTPKPKGSLRHVGHGRLIEQVNNKDWRQAVEDAAVRAAHRRLAPFCGPVAVDATFTVPKPASAPKRRRTLPVTRSSGDLDKLVRLLFDAITPVVMGDDSQVVELHARKVYPGEHPKALDVPGVRVHVWVLEPAPLLTVTTNGESA